MPSSSHIQTRPHYEEKNVGWMPFSAAGNTTPFLHGLTKRHPQENTAVPNFGSEDRTSLNRNCVCIYTCISSLTAFNETCLSLPVRILCKPPIHTFSFAHLNFQAIFFLQISCYQPPCPPVPLGVLKWALELIEQHLQLQFLFRSLREHCSHSSHTNPKISFCSSGLMCNAQVYATKRSICQTFREVISFPFLISRF